MMSRRDDEVAMLLWLMGMNAKNLTEVVWDDSTARPTPLSVACVRLHAADMSGDTDVIADALLDIAELLSAAPELVRATHERVARLRAGMAPPSDPPQGLLRVCFGGDTPHAHSPPPAPFAWYGSRAQEVFLAAVRTGLRSEAAAGEDMLIPVMVLQLLAPTPLMPLPSSARCADVLAMAGDWCRANGRRFHDVATKVGMRVTSKVLTRRRLLNAAANACSRPA